MKKQYWFAILGVCVLLIILFFIVISAEPDAQAVNFAKELIKYPGANEFLKQNPGFLKSISGCPEIPESLKNGIATDPKFVEFIYRNHAKIIRDMKRYPVIRKIFLGLSNYPAAVNFAIQDWDQLAVFFKNHPKRGFAMIDNQEFGHYVLVEHPGSMGFILNSNDPEKAGDSILEAFMREKKVKQFQSK